MATKTPAPVVELDLFTMLVETPGSALISFDEDGLQVEFVKQLTDMLRNDHSALVHGTYADAKRHLKEVERKIPTSRRPDPEKTYPAALKTFQKEIAGPFQAGAMNAPALAPSPSE